jgi:alkylation response protein AidB-like acyl-CoA dehydrogenase
VDFNLSDEETMLRESVSRFVAVEYELTRRQQLMEAGKDHWPRFAELGWTGVGLPEAAGGYDPSLSSVMVIAEALGGGLALEPYIGAAVLTPHVLLAALGAEASADLLAPVIEGSAQIALANAEHEAGAELSFVETQARKSGDGFALSGAKTAVLGGPSATSFLVAARTAGAAHDRDGVSLFHVARDAKGLTVRDYRLIDGSAVSDLTLSDVALPASSLVGKQGAALAALEAGTDIAIIATAFGLVGAMSAALTMTTEHLKTRKQFGGPLRDFQSLRHRAADMLIAIEQARSAAYRGLAGLEHPDPAVRARGASAAKIVAVQSARFVGQNAIQLHGGMGVVDEFRISHLFKYMAVASAQFGSDMHHIKRLGALM